MRKDRADSAGDAPAVLRPSLASRLRLAAGEGARRRRKLVDEVSDRGRCGAPAGAAALARRPARRRALLPREADKPRLALAARTNDRRGPPTPSVAAVSKLRPVRAAPGGVTGAAPDGAAAAAATSPRADTSDSAAARPDGVPAPHCSSGSGARIDAEAVTASATKAAQREAARGAPAGRHIPPPGSPNHSTPLMPLVSQATDAAPSSTVRAAATTCCASAWQVLAARTHSHASVRALALRALTSAELLRLAPRRSARNPAWLAAVPSACCSAKAASLRPADARERRADLVCCSQAEKTAREVARCTEPRMPATPASRALDDAAPSLASAEAVCARVQAMNAARMTLRRGPAPETTARIVLARREAARHPCSTTRAHTRAALRDSNESTREAVVVMATRDSAAAARLDRQRRASSAHRPKAVRRARAAMRRCADATTRRPRTSALHAPRAERIRRARRRSPSAAAAAQATR